MPSSTITRRASTGTGRRVVRAITAVPRHGLAGTAERLRRWVIAPIAARIYLDEHHVWYRVAFADHDAEIPEGFAFRRGHDDDLPALSEIGGVSIVTGREYLRRGAQLYVATHGDELAFATWIHVGAVPLSAARGGWLTLPDGIVSIEDSLAAPDYRTTRVSHWSIDAVTRLQQSLGVEAIITRIAEDNRVARKWARRMGSDEVATMRQRRIGPLRRVWITPVEGGEAIAAMLTDELGAR